MFGVIVRQRVRPKAGPMINSGRTIRLGRRWIGVAGSPAFASDDAEELDRDYNTGPSGTLS
jgi:hypothetical protein